MQESVRQQALRWITEPYDPETRSEVKALLEANDEKALADRFGKPVEFGTAGLRGIIGAGTGYVNEYTIIWVSFALAQYLIKQGKAGGGIVLGYDGRKNSDQFARAACRTFLSQGIPVYFLDFVCPTPVIPFFVRKKKAAAGVVITSSHNPPRYNGYKVYAENGAQIISPFDQEVMKIMSSFNDPGEVIPLITGGAGATLEKLRPEDTRSYVEWAAETANVQPGRTKKIVYTALHGAAGSMAASTFYKAGFRNFASVPAQSEPDMRFPTVTAPNPENPENLKIAIEMAKEKNADLVLANDGDGDRIGLAWKEGDEFYIPGGNEIGTMLLYYLLKKLKEQGRLSQNSFAVSTIVSTPLTRSICEYFHVTYRETLTGFKWMGNLADELTAKGRSFVYAFEEAFGVTYGDSRDKDGITAILLAAHLHEEIGFGQLKKEMQNLFGLRLEGALEKEYAGAEGKQVMNAILDSVRAALPPQIGRYKVLKVRDILRRTQTEGNSISAYEELPVQNLLYFHLEKDAWAALRPSGTEPKLKIYFGINAGQANEIQARNELGLLQKELEKLLT